VGQLTSLDPLKRISTTDIFSIDDLDFACA
jgi:hypothetical protein